MIREARAMWHGTGRSGSGTLSSDSGVLAETPYSFRTRFENAKGTNPEELIAAAHAGCFSMKLAFVLNEAGFTADEINTDCTITMEGMSITSSHLVLKAKVPGIDKAKFDAAAADAKANCPISQLLKTNITLEATLL